MILSLGQGEPSYIPDGLIGMARDQADVSYLAFLQCYARDLAQWEIICFFASHQQEWCSAETVAAEVGYPLAEIEVRLAMLAERGLLEESVAFNGLEYGLTRSVEMRRLALRLGSEWRCSGNTAE